MDPSDVVTVPFRGVTGVKLRPAVVLSSATYHSNRPDVILGLLTTQIHAATGPTDYVLQDWSAAGLHRPTAFRSFLLTTPNSDVYSHVGRLSNRDWQEVRACLQLALSMEDPPTGP